jgi:molybdate transport system permease protein
VKFAPLVLSFEVAFFAALLCAVAGTAIAISLAARRFWGRDFVDALLMAPMVMPPTVLGYYVLVAFGRSSPLGRAYESITGSPIVFTKTGAVLAATIGAMPIMIKTAKTALESVDGQLLAAARTLGASPLRAWLSIALPLASRGIGAAVALSFARALGDFGITLMVGGDIPGQTQTAALAIYDLHQANRDRQATGMIALLTGLAIAVLYLVNKAERRERDR